MLIFVILIIAACKKDHEPVIVEKNVCNSYIIAGDTTNNFYFNISPNIIIKRIEAVNPMLTAMDTLMSSFEKYFFDSDSLDIDKDGKADLLFYHVEGFTCTSKEWYPGGDTTCTSSSSLYGRVFKSLNKNVKISNIIESKSIICDTLKWDKNTSIFFVPYGIDLFVGIKKDTLFGWLRFENYEDSLIIKDYAIMKN